jgi:putative aldouronate transport system substrate-binding protein
MSSGDYPDAFINWGGGNANMLRYGVDQGIYIPLTGLIPANMPHFMERTPKIDPDVLKKLTAPDGNIYSLPLISWNDSSVPNVAFINKTWLDKLGLGIPATTAEFAEVLRAFRNGDPNGNGQRDEIPLSFLFDDWGAYDHTSYFGAFGYPLSPGDYTVVDNGKAVFIGTDDGFKAGVQYFAGLYADGLIDREVFTQDQAALVAKQNADPMTVGVFNSWANYSTNHYDDYVMLPPLKGPSGEQNWLYSGSESSFSRDVFIVTDKAKNPEVLLRWADQFYRDFETGFTAMMGMGPDRNKYWYYDESGNMVLNPNYPPEYERGMQQHPFPPAALEPDLFAAVMGTSGLSKDKVEYINRYGPYIQKYITGNWRRFPEVVFTTSEENEELVGLTTDVVSYAKNQLARWISGDGSVNAEWDAYLRELDKLGLQRYLEMKQTIYNRYMGE